MTTTNTAPPLGENDGLSTPAAGADAGPAVDACAAARRARFGVLPERVRADLTRQEVRVAPGGDVLRADRFGANGSWSPYSCLVLDLGL
ncbi:hypothetical protein [Streptomyces sp. NPDC088923]|uniref:hypothetical protein n=1 Tax=Streptomyces sp. NPDC088923 TaxID=3365913 RepID=UPI00382C98A8